MHFEPQPPHDEVPEHILQLRLVLEAQSKELYDKERHRALRTLLWSRRWQRHARDRRRMRIWRDNPDSRTCPISCEPLPVCSTDPDRPANSVVCIGQRLYDGHSLAEWAMKSSRQCTAATDPFTRKPFTTAELRSIGRATNNASFIGTLVAVSFDIDEYLLSFINNDLGLPCIDTLQRVINFDQCTELFHGFNRQVRLAPHKAQQTLNAVRANVPANELPSYIQSIVHITLREIHTRETTRLQNRMAIRNGTTPQNPIVIE